MNEEPTLEGVVDVFKALLAHPDPQKEFVANMFLTHGDALIAELERLWEYEDNINSVDPS